MHAHSAAWTTVITFGDMFAYMVPGLSPADKERIRMFASKPRYDRDPDELCPDSEDDTEEA